MAGKHFYKLRVAVFTGYHALHFMSSYPYAELICDSGVPVIVAVLRGARAGVMPLLYPAQEPLATSDCQVRLCERNLTWK